MKTDLNTLLTALYVDLEDRALPAIGWSWVHRPGRKPGSAEGSVDFLTALRSGEDSPLGAKIYSAEFKAGALELLASGMTQKEVCADLGVWQVSGAGLGPLSSVGPARLRASY